MFNFTIRYWQFGKLGEMTFNGPDFNRLQQFIFDHEDGELLFYDGWYNDDTTDQNGFDYDHLSVLLDLMNYAEGIDIT